MEHLHPSSPRSRLRTAVTALLLALTIICLVACATADKNSHRQRKAPRGSVRWRVMSHSALSMFENGLLLLMTGAPLQSLRAGFAELRQCMSSAYDEQVVQCVSDPARSAAASWFVLTDVRTWVWPPDDDDDSVDSDGKRNDGGRNDDHGHDAVVDEVMLDVLTRRLRPAVRDDQCGNADRPTSSGRRDDTGYDNHNR